MKSFDMKCKLWKSIYSCYKDKCMLNKLED